MDWIMHWPHQIDADWKAISALAATCGLHGLHFSQTDWPASKYQVLSNRVTLSKQTSWRSESLRRWSINPTFSFLRPHYKQLHIDVLNICCQPFKYIKKKFKIILEVHLSITLIQIGWKFIGLSSLIKLCFHFQYYEMSYGLNIEMHKQVST